MEFFGLVLAALMGLLLGMMGGGGSILTVPIFVYILSYDPKQAIASSLFVVGITSLVGSILHWRRKNVVASVAASFAPAAIAGTFLGARLSSYMTGGQQMLLFACVLLVAAVLMVKKSFGPEKVDTYNTSSVPVWLIVPQAFFVGIVTGLVGVGGGFMIVPALVILARISMRQAVGTSLLVITLNCISGFVGYLGQIQISWSYNLAFAGLAAVGIFFGARLVQHISQRQLKRVFAVFLVIMGLTVLYKNLAS